MALNGVVQLPQSTIVKENGVIIEHYYGNDHAPAHAHIYEEGKKKSGTKIGENGKPLKGERELTPKEAKVVDRNKSKIRRTIRRIRKWLGVKKYGEEYYKRKNSYKK